jgi:osmotically-inducible protein OsmY
MRLRVFLIGLGAGALLALFADPASGKRRRAMARDKAGAYRRRSSRQVAAGGRSVRSGIQARKARLAHRTPVERDYDDATLTDHVRSELGRDPLAHQGILVNAQRGVIQLRGQVGSEDDIEELVKRTEEINGVRAVENLLHVPGTPAPRHH